MYNIAVIVNENIPEQLEIFLKTFREINKSDLIDYTFIITSTRFIRKYEGCRHELLQPYKNDHRLGFLNKLDQILTEKFDLVIVSYDMIFCRRSIVAWLTNLIEYTDEPWELCGSAITPPMFPLSMCQTIEFAPLIPKEYVTIDSGFYILNPRTVESDNAEFASQIITNDRYDLLDELVFNIRYDKKIVNQLICCNAIAYIDNLEDVKNANMNLYYKPVKDNTCWYFLKEYYDHASAAMQHDIKSILRTCEARLSIQQRSKESLMTQNIVVARLDKEEIYFTKL